MNSHWFNLKSQTLGILICGLLLLIASPLLIAQSAQDGFAPLLGTSGQPGEATGVAAMHVQPDGKLLIAGQFATINGVTKINIAQLNVDGSIDDSFDAAAGTNSAITDILIQPDSKIVIAGNFTFANGISTPRVARLNADGSIDSSFSSGISTSAFGSAVAMQSDGKILLVGNPGITRLNTDGSIDSTFTPASIPGPSFGLVQDVITLPDDKIIIVGDFTDIDGISQRGIAQLLPDGQLDTTFDPGSGADDEVMTVARQQDGKIYIGGRFSNINGVARSSVARLLADGSLDTDYVPTLNPAFNARVFAVTIQADGNLLVAGEYSANGGMNRNLARLLGDGSLDSSFLFSSFDNGVGRINALAVQQDDQILLGSSQLFRVSRDAQLDVDFAPSSGTDDFVTALAWQDDGKALISGSFTDVNGSTQNRIARLNVDGSTDTTYMTGAGLSASGLSFKVLPNGDSIVGGLFTSVDGQSRDRIASLGSDGSLLPEFALNLSTTGVVDTIVRQADGKILIGGTFTMVNGVSRNRIARLNADGSLDTGFDPGTGANDRVQDIAVEPGGGIYAVGDFTEFNGATRNRLVKLFTNGALDTNVNNNTGADNRIFDVAVQLDGKVLVGGQFRDYGGITRRGIARLLPNTGLDTTFDTELGALFVESIAPQANGKILLGGSFTSTQGQTRNRISRLNADGTLDSSFDGSFGADSVVTSLQLMPNGKVLAAGDFSMLGGQSRGRIGRFSLAEPALQEINIQGDQLSWTIGGSMPVPESVFFQTANDGINFGAELSALLNNGVWERNFVAVDAGFAWLRVTGRFGPNQDFSFTRRVMVSSAINILAGNGFDFGNVPVGEFSQPAFNIQNPGDARLVITGVSNIDPPFSIATSGSCGAFPITIDPGRSCSLGFRFEPDSAGEFTQTVMIESNAPDSPTPFTLTGTGVVPELTITPTVIDFGDQPIDTTSSVETITLENTGDANLQIQTIGPASAPFNNVTSNCGATLVPQATCILTYTFAPQATGMVMRDIVIDTNAPSSPDSFQLSGNGTQALLSISQPQLNFGNQAINTSSISMETTLSNLGDAGLMITALTPAAAPFATASGSCGNLPIVIGVGSSCTLAYTFSPTVVGPVMQTITLSSNSPSSPDSLSLSGSGVGAMLEVMPDLLDFGEWPIGMDSTPEMAIIESSGQTDLMIGNITIVGQHQNDFMLVTATDQCSNQSIPVSDFCGFEVVFNPSDAGIREARVQILSNVPGGPKFIRLRGTNDVLFFDGFDDE